MLLSTISNELSIRRICEEFGFRKKTVPPVYYLFLNYRLLAADSIIDIIQAPGDIDKHLHARPIDEADSFCGRSVIIEF